MMAQNQNNTENQKLLRKILLFLVGFSVQDTFQLSVLLF